MLLLVALLAPVAAQAQSVSIDMGAAGQAGATGRLVQLTALVTVLSIAPSLLVMMTAFTRIIIVLIGLALFLTYFVMQPVLDQAWTTGLLPLTQGHVTEMEGLRLTAEPFRRFMVANLRGSDLQVFLDLGHLPVPPTPDDAPWRALIPAFMVGELRRAFEIGFLLFLPFLVIDMV